MSDSDRVHTCHAECPCQSGGEPSPDFLPVEGSLVPLVGYLQLLEERAVQRAALDEKRARTEGS